MSSEIGKITLWNDDKGFGFITPKSGGKSVFLHINNFSKRHKRPIQGLSVIYTLSKDTKGRACATNVLPEKGHLEFTKADQQKIFSIFISSAFILTVTGLVLFHKLPTFILGFYIVVSTITFGLYLKDKSAAQSGKWRTSEGTLHLFSLAGGWPGAAIAQSQLRHKSKKLSFRVVYWFTVIINCGILGWLLTAEGSYLLNVILKNMKNINFG
ncbi:MAG TPA: DUF1294 domain-containing protein [Desulfobulbaceae bacterium]|nr:DUF1294 domain-containing protein [Desulfobulbaceae bacterium]